MLDHRQKKKASRLSNWASEEPHWLLRLGGTLTCAMPDKHIAVIYYRVRRLWVYLQKHPRRATCTNSSVAPHGRDAINWVVPPPERWLLGLTGFQAPGDSLCGTGFWKAVRRQGARNAFASLLLLGKDSWLEASAGVHIGHSGGERCALVARRCCIQWPQTFGLCLTKRKRLCTNSCENK